MEFFVIVRPWFLAETREEPRYVLDTLSFLIYLISLVYNPLTTEKRRGF